MICGAAFARPTPTVSTKSFETSSQKLNNSGISAHPTPRTIKKVNRMETFFTDCLSLWVLFAVSLCEAREIESATFTTGNLPYQHKQHHGSPRSPVQLLRRPTSETTNSLSVCDRVRSISGDFSGGGRRVLKTLGFESESQLVS